MLATEYAQQFNLQPQRENESDIAFKNRIACELRDRGEFVYAHEAYQDRFYDQSPDAMTGITGAVAQAMLGVDYGSSGTRQIGDDIAAGHVVQKPKEDQLMLLLAMAFFGGERK